MGSWTEQFENHPINQTLESVKSLLTELSGKDYDDFEIVENIQRIDQIVSQVSMTLDKADPILVNFATLNDMNNHLATIVNQLNSFKETSDKGQIINANGTATNLIGPITNIIVPKDKVDIKAMRDAASKFRNSVSQYTRQTKDQLSKLSERIEQVNQSVNEITTNVENQKSSLEEATKEHQNQFAQAEEERRKKFTEYEVNWNKEYNEYLSGRKEEFKNAYANVLKELDENRKQFDAQMDAHNKKVEKLVGAISLKGHSAGFHKVANQEKWSRRIFQFLAVVALLGLVGAAYLVFEAAIDPEIKWYALTGKIVLTSAVGILAAYLARQAEKHQETERRNRKMELELASIETYLTGLPPEIQHKIKESLSGKFFAAPEPVKLKRKERMSGNLSDFVRFVEKLSSVFKKNTL